MINFRGGRNTTFLKLKFMEEELKEQLNLLEAKILNWYIEHGKDKEFAEYFGIETHIAGKI